MNNKNKILVGCLALLLVLSVGYALFSETIEINGTATAKGNFDITPSCQVGNVYEDRGVDSGYNSDKCAVVDNVVTYSVNLEKPGARRQFTIVMKNTGSIPAMFTENDIKNTEKVCIDSDRDNIIETSDECLNDSTFVSAAGVIGFLTTDGTFVSTEKDDISSFVDGDNIILEPNESIVTRAIFDWDTNDDEEKYNNALISMEATTTIDFKQVSN